MQLMKMLNPTDKPIAWSMDNAPGRPPTKYECNPGETVDVPVPYVNSGAIERLAPGLVPAPEDPEAAAKAAKAAKAAEKEAAKEAAKAEKEKAAALKAAEGD